MIEFLAAFVLVAVSILTIVALCVSRINGSVVSDRFNKMNGRLSAREFIRKNTGEKVVIRGRWAWDYDGDAYIKVLGLWWGVPPRLSLRAFRVVLLDKQVNA